MNTIHISKRKLLFAALAVIALVGVACVLADVERDPGDGAAHPAAKAALPNADSVALTEAQVEAVTTAAGNALIEIMHLDHAEGRDARRPFILPV